jgi:hypothetical protein
MTVWTWLWVGWGAYFAVVEGMALANSTAGDTLSEHVWAFLGYSGGVKYPTGWTRLRRFLVLAFLAWLVVHFLTGGLF